MKVLVLGAGVIGVTTAYFLRDQGAEVTVVDRQPGPALETSFANGGHLSVGQAAPWATPEAPWQLLKWAGRRDAPLRLRARWDPALWRWGLQFLRNCTPGRFRANSQTLERLAAFSHDCLGNVMRAHPELDFGYQANGLLTVFRTAQALGRAARQSETTNPVLDSSGCLEVEPALASAVEAGKIAGGILAPDAASGDAQKFTAQLAAVCAERGVRFRFGETVSALERVDGAITGAVTTRGTIAADAVVVALGSYSRGLARTVGLDLPIVPVKGYSVTLPTNGATAPKLGILDAERKVVMTVLGGGLRVAGTAEFAGYDTALDPLRLAAITATALDLFPDFRRIAHTPDDRRPWAGIRPMTPDGSPLLGPAPEAAGCANLFFNTGHGPLGWTLACGSAKLIAEWIGGGRPADPAERMGLTLGRFT